MKEKCHIQPVPEAEKENATQCIPSGPQSLNHSDMDLRNGFVAGDSAPKNNVNEAKPDLSLLPLDILEGLAMALQYGLHKYYRDSWRKGFDSNVVVAACLRHIRDWNNNGEEYDVEAEHQAGMQVHHIDMAIFNLVALKNTILHHPEMINRAKERESNGQTNKQE